MNPINFERPEFTAAIRGYDRLQVDEYIARLHELVAEAEDRARESEAELEFSRHSTVGPRVTEIFELAIAEAKELREKNNADCDRARDEARAEVDRLLKAGQEEAVEIKERAEQEREQVLARLEDERHEAELEIARLDGTKQTMLAELRRLQEALAAAAGTYGAPGSGEVPEDDADTVAMDDEERADAA